MKLSVIIVNYNVKYFLEQCLLSVYESKTDFEMEVIVVDNNSTDNSQQYITERFPQTHYIQNTDNPGFSKANNQAIKISRGEYVLLLNPDTVVGENVLQNICRFMDIHPESGAIGVKMINGSGQFLPESKRGFPSPWNSFCKIFGLTKLFPKSKVFGKYHLRYLDENKTHKVDVLAGAFMMLRKSVIDKAGYLDETFFMYGEDIDLSYRIVKAGYKNYYLPEKIIHYKGESTSKDEMKYVKVFYQAMFIFFKKHYPNYGKIYSFFISSGIWLRASVSALRRLIGIKSEELPNDNIVLLDHTSLSYEEIISIMDSNKQKDIQYHIYSPKSGMTIGAHFAQKKEEKTNF
ncbi:glycosyltransferase family 2 protein [Dysgonomonas sp. 520]|uniref:glycosyltransferase family 2 protein n=1 Tax=Dysgonomonas sp. 520 TaxID=2302931 RepID=UPI0013D76AA1|nr:glycosyltransferase family 2 protein [Dysgonomonas sp. 520]NDW08385.1 glycosyltransferase family 2 protein [Dysgonomonas sp. 520]